MSNYTLILLIFSISTVCNAICAFFISKNLKKHAKTFCERTYKSLTARTEEDHRKRINEIGKGLGYQFDELNGRFKTLKSDFDSYSVKYEDLAGTAKTFLSRANTKLARTEKAEELALRVEELEQQKLQDSMNLFNQAEQEVEGPTNGKLRWRAK